MDAEIDDKSNVDCHQSMADDSKSICFEFFRPKNQLKINANVESVRSSFVSLSQRVFPFD